MSSSVWMLIFSALFIVFANCDPQCTLPGEEYRFDCFPDDAGNGTAEEICHKRGCCWEKAKSAKYDFSKSNLHNKSVELPLSVPYCFFPTNYGYLLASKSETNTGYKLSLSRQGSYGPFGGDVKELTVDVLLEDENRVHFKVMIFGWRYC